MLDFGGRKKDIRRNQLSRRFLEEKSQSVITFSKLTIETLEQGVKYVQS